MKLPNEWTILEFPKTVLKNMTGKENQITASDIKQVGKYPVIDQGQNFIAGYTDETNRVYKPEQPVFVFGDHTRCFKYVDFPFVIGADGTKIIFPNTELFNPKYYYYFLLGLNIPNRGYNRHYKLLKEQNIICPPMHEQENIAKILSQIQLAIEIQEKIIRTTTEFKKALMQKLFTEGLNGEPQKHTEIGKIPESWKVFPLEDMIIDINYGTSVKCDYIKKGFPVLRIPNVVGGSIDINDLKYGQLKKNEISKLKLTKGDLLFVRTNGVQENTGRCSIYKGELEECYFASYLIRVQLDKLKLIPEYMNEYSKTETGKSFLSGRAIRTADGKFNINSNTIKKILVAVPEIEEQNEIAQNLDSIEQKICLHIQKHLLLKELFSSMLKCLMTGQIRVNKLELS